MNHPTQFWRFAIVATTVVISVPVITIASSIFAPSGDAWEHLRETVLSEYVLNSALLMLGVAAGTLLLGVSTAWLTAMCDFPARRLFVWMLLLPLAMPAYIIAYTYTGMFDFAGPVQTALREWTGWQHGDYWFPQVRSLGGAAVMLSLVLYPYVYLLARAAFLEQSISALESSRTLGCSPWHSFTRVALPLARPSIVAGLSLALMETLADYGTVAYFGVSVFTTGIFRTWFSLGDSVAASKLAAILLTFVFVLIMVERASRQQARYHHTAGAHANIKPVRLRGRQALGAFLICALPVAFGFLLPGMQLFAWALDTYEEMLDERFFALSWHSIVLALGAAVLSVCFALFLAYGRRLLGGRLIGLCVRVASMGYAIPGTVIAVGVIGPMVFVDRAINAATESLFGVTVGLVISGTVIALLFAYLIRFLAVSLQAVETGLARIRPSMEDSARSLGQTPMRVLLRVHVPMMRGSVMTAALLVFVDVMKELPATLVLRPFDFNTLAVRAFELASDERLADSSTAALMIVGLGLAPVILLSRSISHARAGQGRSAARRQRRPTADMGAALSASPPGPSA